MTIGNKLLTGITAVMALAALSACSKYSHVGYQSEPAPHAVAVTIGEPFTNDSSGNLQATVRAGGEVVLSGKDSEKGANDTGVPLINFKWEQLAAGNNAVQFIQRTTNTISFTAPQVTSVTTLDFRLTVSDAKGNTATTDAHITVQPINDQDHFLQFLNVSNTIPVVMATTTPIAADTTAAATATLPVSVTITKLVTFPDRNDSTITHTRVVVGSPVTISTGWNAKLGSSISCTSNQNPTLQVPVPRLNLDDLLPAGAFPDAVVLSDLLEPADIDKATLEVRIDVTSSNNVVTTAVPVACISGTALAAGVPIGAAPTTVTTWPSGTFFTTDVLLTNATPHDSKATALAYFATIDPTNNKDTLDRWLVANGFSTTASAWNADAHAIYTNNFDLGFGRDMYMKIGGTTGKCDDGTTALPVTPAHINSGLCDVAAVVVNYSGVEATAKKLNPINAVAMEYTAAATGGVRFVKFYAFVPDTRSGVFIRVLSVNLDRRGEQSMPQSCVVCHGGLPGIVTAGVYAANGDVKAAFLPWDLDSLFYSDTEPGFSTKPRDAALRATYTRSLQETQFKTLNAGAYLTMADPTGAAGRYAVVRELVEGWYGGSATTGLTAAQFNGGFIPPGWQPVGLDAIAGTADDNPADSGTLYTDVFARNCRMCHTVQVPASGDPRTATVTIAGVASPIAACTNDTRLANSRVGSPFQVPMGCYWEFAHAPNLADRLSRNQMPFARRSSDRLWVNTSVAKTAGTILQAHLLAEQNVTVATPGTVSTCIDTAFGTATQAQGVTKYQVARNAWVNLASTCSRFVTAPQWTLTAPSGSTAILIGADTLTPRFLPDVQGDYTLRLTDGASMAASASVVAQVPVATPTAGNGGVAIVLGAGGTGTADVDVTTLAGYQSRDPLTSLTIASQNGVTATALNTTTVRITVSSLAGGTATYTLTDSDGDQSAAGTINVTVTASIAASNATVTFATNSAGNAVNLDNLISRPAGQAVTITASQPTTQRSRGIGHVSVDGAGQATYDAPLGVMSHFAGVLISTAGRDQFSFTGCFVLQPAVCSSGTITVQLSGTNDGVHDFPAVQAQLSTNCGSLCHNAPQINANAGYIIAASYADAAARKTLYCELQLLTAVNDGSDILQTEPNGTPYLNLTTPSSSLLYLMPQPNFGHGGGPEGTPLTYSTVLNWINEGAYFTEPNATGQNCP